MKPTEEGRGRGLGYFCFESGFIDLPSYAQERMNTVKKVLQEQKEAEQQGEHWPEVFILASMLASILASMLSF
jgi:hypothetical protein